MTDNPNILALNKLGVSVWLDDLSRGRLINGELAKLTKSAGIVGITTNPAIFANSLRNDASYQGALTLLSQQGATPEEAVEAIMCQDVAAACDMFAQKFAESDAEDGRVSIEVSPLLAHDAESTIAAGIRLWKTVAKPNAMIKVPATSAGLEAITALISQGISVNVTLIFSLERYRAVVNAYLTGLELAQHNSVDLSQVHSVASFFISRMDSEVDPQLRESTDPLAVSLVGNCAIANARLAYDIHAGLFSSERATYLLQRGANVQRLLWASTGVKDSAYEKTRYVTELAGAGVVNTMPEGTLDAVLEFNGLLSDRLTDHIQEAHDVLDALERVGFNYSEIVERLELEGIDKFLEAHEQLLSSAQHGLYG
jgi:transaldolase